ncbi:hypothetical protein C2S52_001883 [Perilla frutescens var. hirtella]|nr:hypothetical protein C2S52_001883 [Perilla frutescens var. hirtella]
MLRRPMMNMNILQLPLLHFIFFTLLLLPPAFSSGLVPKPGCRDRCGNVLIPFPFGVGSDCSFGKYFNITCNTSNNTPTPYLSFFEDIEVVEINPSQIRIRFKRLLEKVCYNKSGHRFDGMENIRSGFSFSDTPFTFSDENWLTTIGCHDSATIFTTDDEGFRQDEQKFGSSCVSYCSNITDSAGVGFCPDNDIGYPSAMGCCVTTVPRGITQVLVKLTDLANEWRVGEGRLFSCSYVFLQEKLTPNKSKFSYPLSYLNNPNEFLDAESNWKTRAPPVVRLDWRINEGKNCSEARRNATGRYACQDNSLCVDYDAPSTVGGYLCSCKQGYNGNPYSTGGCRDIDECGDSPCDSNSICTNTLGSFACSCRRGYSGDGRKNGRGCLPSKITNIFIGVSSGLGFFLLLSICILLRKAFKKRKNRMRKERFFKQNGGLLLQQRTNEGTIGETKLFLVEELEKATDDFNKTRILGQGGQGIVYKGMLSNGQIVAIKKSKLAAKDQLDQFINEIVILSQINHRNVVRMLGCCLETEVLLLVYEFLPNGTLSNLIHDPSTEVLVSWNMRLKIAADIAGALAYLHSASSTSIYHRDIKSGNILLDEKYVVKVSDFGISRFVEVDQTHLTTRVKGTFGYFDPEYFQSNQFTEKSDVYSFGVVLAELLTGQRPISLEKEEDERSLVTRFLASIEDNNVDTILDPQVLKQGGKEEVSAVVLLTRKCLNLQGKMRPTMKEVATELESLRLSQMPTTITHKSQETRVCESKSMMIPDTDYTWTASDIVYANFLLKRGSDVTGYGAVPNVGGAGGASSFCLK